MRRFHGISLLLLALAGSELPAQSDASCEARLAAPTADSALVTFATTVASFDDRRPLPAWYSSLLADGLRGQLRVPTPLMFTAWEVDRLDTATHTFRAVPALSALYGVTLDGVHFRDVRFLTGTLSSDLDRAIRNALAGLDSSGDLPPLPDSTSREPLELRFTIARERPTQTGRVDSSATDVPLFRVRLPAHAITQVSLPDSPKGFQQLIPHNIRLPGAGSITFELRVSEIGEVDPASVRILSYSSMDLAKAVYPRIAKIHFTPLSVEGCPVTSVVRLGTSYEGRPVRE